MPFGMVVPEFTSHTDATIAQLLEEKAQYLRVSVWHAVSNLLTASFQKSAIEEEPGGVNLYTLQAQDFVVP